MSEYLTKEEIRKWRSSLESITLEEYASRLGKIIQEEKHDDSLVDSVMFKSLNSMTQDVYIPKVEKIQSLAMKSFNKEKEINKVVPQKSRENIQVEQPVEKTSTDSLNADNVVKIPQKQDIKEVIHEALEIELPKTTKKESLIEKEVEEVIEINESSNEEKTINSTEKKEEAQKTEIDIVTADADISFNKALTTREQLVFEHFLANKNSIVYAKDLAEILSLPKDYVYKYIKNLRSKLNDNILSNAENGGYVLRVK